MILKELQKHLGYPSATKLYQAARREGLQVTKVDAAAAAAGATSEVLKRQKKGDPGAIAATDFRDQAQADLLDVSSGKKSDGEWN